MRAQNSLLCGFGECASLSILRRVSAMKVKTPECLTLRNKEDKGNAKWVRTMGKVGLYSVCYSNRQFVIEVLGSPVSHHVLWQCQTLAPTDIFFIDTGSAAQSLNPDSVQMGIRGDWETQRPCSDAHLNKLVYKNTPVEDTSTNVEEWDMHHSMADRELSENTLDNHSTTAKCFSHRFKFTALEM